MPCSFALAGKVVKHQNMSWFITWDMQVRVKSWKQMSV